MKNLTIAQKIGIKWLVTIDSNTALYFLLKPLPPTLRAFFYSVLIVGTFIISKVGLSFLDLLNSTTYVALIPTFGVAGIVFYESLFKIDIEDILQGIRKEKRERETFLLKLINSKNGDCEICLGLYDFFYIFVSSYFYNSLFNSLPSLHFSVRQQSLWKHKPHSF